MSDRIGRAREYVLARRIFLRLLGLVHLIAFASLLVQIRGLVGENGIIPAGETLGRAASLFGVERFVSFPTVFWIISSDVALLVAAAAGTLLSVLLILYVAPGPILFVLWILYLSFFSIGVDFMAFQWDEFLVEVTFLGALWAPWRFRPLSTGEPPPSEPIRLLFKFLLFRLYFMAGVVKIVTSESSWWELTALQYYFEVIPLPNPASWWMHHMPSFVHTAGTLAVLVVHLLFGLFLIAPGRWSLLGSIPNVAVQGLILVTANYGFFNLVTIATHVTLLDDGLIRRGCERLKIPCGLGPGQALSRMRRTPVAAVAAGLVLLASLHVARGLDIAAARTGLAGTITGILQPYRIANFYGPWPGVPKRRIEIVFEGSDDQVNWREYVFRYKPGPPDRMPTTMLGHLPRLDYRLWFAQFGEFHDTHWLPRFMERLREGSPDVLDLLDRNPFPDTPPRHVRANLYEYRFASPQERRQGRWWVRRHLRLFGP